MLRYTITDVDYLNMAREMLNEQRGPKKAAILKLLLNTVIQMGVAAFLILYYQNVSPWMKWMVGILSLLWAAFSLFRFFFVDLRANILVKQSKNDPRNADFWKEHHLDTDGEEKLRLSYGDTRLELPFDEVTAVKETDTLLLIFRDKFMFELVPKRAAGDGEALRELILTKRDQEKKNRLEELRASLTEDAVFVRKLDLDREELAEKSIRMKRASYRYAQGWTLSKVFSLLFPLGLAVYCAATGAWPYFALCLATFLLFNYNNLVIFAPAYRAIVREQIPEPPEDGYQLILKDKTLWLITAVKAFSYPLDQLKKTVKTDDGLYLYFDKQVMLYVPASAADVYLRAVSRKKSLRDKAAIAVPYEEAVKEEEPDKKQ